MCVQVVEGYLQIATTDAFKQAASEGAAAGVSGTLEVLQRSLKTLLGKAADSFSRHTAKLGSRAYLKLPSCSVS